MLLSNNNPTTFNPLVVGSTWSKAKSGGH